MRVAFTVRDVVDDDLTAFSLEPAQLMALEADPSR